MMRFCDTGHTNNPHTTTDVQFVEQDQVVKADQFYGNDPRRSEQWGLRSVQTNWAWTRTRGSATIKVCIVDTGVDVNHPDIKPNFRSGRGDDDAWWCVHGDEYSTPYVYVLPVLVDHVLLVDHAHPTSPPTPLFKVFKLRGSMGKSTMMPLMRIPMAHIVQALQQQWATMVWGSVA